MYITRFIQEFSAIFIVLPLAMQPVAINHFSGLKGALWS